jgi:hypothetical protein
MILLKYATVGLINLADEVSHGQDTTYKTDATQA